MIDRINCRVCKKDKSRHSSSHRPGKYYSKYNKPWASADVCSKCTKLGRTVPECDDESTWEPSKYHTHKSCDTCEGQLELANYRTCVECKRRSKVAELHSRYDDSPSYVTIREKMGFKISEMPLLAGGYI